MDIPVNIPATFILLGPWVGVLCYLTPEIERFDAQNNP